MNSFDINKIVMALLLTVLVMIGIGGITEVVFDEEKLEKNAYPIEVAATEPAATEHGVEAAAVEAGPSLAQLLAMASVKDGNRVFKKCKSCHTGDKGGKNRVGPNLWNVVGRPKGSMEGFGYSDGMKGKGGTWTYEDLNHFLTKPSSFVPKTKMSFSGLKKASDRAAIIALLRSNSDEPMAMPAVEIPAIEMPGGEIPAVEIPAIEMPKDEMPEGEMPAIETPKDEIPAIETPKDAMPTIKMLEDEIPAIEMPKDEMPAADVNVEKGAPVAVH